MLSNTSSDIIKTHNVENDANDDDEDEDSDLEPEKDDEDETEIQIKEKYPVNVTRLLKMNGPEWMFILVGCIAAIIVGASLPAFAILFGEVYGVSF